MLTLAPFAVVTVVLDDDPLPHAATTKLEMETNEIPLNTRFLLILLISASVFSYRQQGRRPRAFIPVEVTANFVNYVLISWSYRKQNVNTGHRTT